MAQRQTTELLHDMDGSPTTQTVSFGIEGVLYEIDLSDAHAKSLRAGVDVFVQHARKVGRRKVGHRDNFKRTTLTPDSRLVRSWAQGNGYAVNGSGGFKRSSQHGVDSVLTVASRAPQPV